MIIALTSTVSDPSLPITVLPFSVVTPVTVRSFCAVTLPLNVCAAAVYYN
jgi:hypothetical protein